MIYKCSKHNKGVNIIGKTQDNISNSDEDIGERLKHRGKRKKNTRCEGGSVSGWRVAGVGGSGGGGDKYITLHD